MYLTPPPILEQLGQFDLDPCSPINRPWDTAKKHYTIEDDGLLMPWDGRVWCNPPYGRKLGHWIEKMALHNNGIALTFARTDTRAFQNYVFPFAESLFFINGRVKFYDANGNQSKSNGGAPSVLISYGEYNAEVLSECNISGHHVPVKPTVMVYGMYRSNDTWQIIVNDALEDLNGKASLSEIYDCVISMAPGKVKTNNHYKAKIRQTLQMHFNRVERGVYKN